MAPKSLGPADGRFHRARRAIRKLMVLGLTEKQVIHLFQALRVPRRRVQPGSKPSRELDQDQEARLRATQGIIRTMMDLGFKEVDIAEITGFDHTSVAHILRSEGSRLISQETAIVFKDALLLAGKERLKRLLPRLEIQVLDGCCGKGSSLDETTRTRVAESIRDVIRNALLGSSGPIRAVADIPAALAELGDPSRPVYVLVDFMGPANTDAENVARLLRMEHEVEHLRSRLRADRKRLETQLRNGEHAKQEARNEVPKEGLIA